MAKVSTTVYTGAAAYGRTVYMEINDNEVVFDDSDGEYGPTYIPLELLEQKIKEHKEKMK